MGGINPNIALAARAPDIQIAVPNPIQQFGQILSLGDLMQRGQLGNIQIQEAQLALENARLIADERRRMGPYFANPPQAAAAGTMLAPSQTPGTPMPMAPVAPPQQPLGPGTAVPFSPNQPFPVLAPGISPGANQTLPMPGGVTATPDALAPMQKPGAAITPTPTAANEWAFAGGVDPKKFMRDFPLTGGAVIKQYYDSMESALKAQHQNWTVQKDRIDRMSGYAQSIIPGNQGTVLTAVTNALNSGDITPEQARQLNNVPSDDPSWKLLVSQAVEPAKYVENQIAQADLAIRQTQEARAAALGKIELTGKEKEQLKGDLGIVARQMPQVTAAENPQAAWEQVLAGSPENVRKFFGADTQGKGGLQYSPKLPGIVNLAAVEPKVGETFPTPAPVIAGKGLETGVTEAARLEAQRGAGGIDIPGVMEQVYQNPDTAQTALQSIPEAMRSSVYSQFRAKYGVPFPKPLEGAAGDREAAAKTTQTEVEWLRNAMQNPQIRHNLGPLLGKLQDPNSITGLAKGYLGDPRLAQEFRTHTRNLVMNEAGAFKARVSGPVMDELQKTSGDVKMTPDQFQGALDGVQESINNKLDEAEMRRFGGYKRPDRIRNPARAVPANVEQALKDSARNTFH